jgi:hypothetical protein
MGWWNALQVLAKPTPDPSTQRTRRSRGFLPLCLETLPSRSFMLVIRYQTTTRPPPVVPFNPVVGVEVYPSLL